LSAEVSAAYDSETGALAYTGAPALEIENLASLSLELGIDRLTPSLVEALRSIPISELENALFTPGFAELGIARVKIDLKDNSLIDKILAMKGKQLGQDLEGMRTTVAGSAAALIELSQSSVPNAPALGKLASELILKPGRLAIEMAPQEPLSMTSILRSSTQSELLNSLNISVAVNEGPPLTLAFAEPPAPPAGDEPPEGLERLEDLEDLDNFEDLDLENLDLENLNDLDDLSLAPGGPPAPLSALKAR
jgi:hypothetical protein